MVEEFIKFDKGKPLLAYLPTEELEDIAGTFDYGAEKYERDNWKKPHDTMRMASALLRHIFAFLRGEENDKESGRSHLSHAGCCLLMLMWHINQRRKNETYKEKYRK